MFVLEPKRSVGQAAQTITEICVDRSGINDAGRLIRRFAVGETIQQCLSFFQKIDAKPQLDIWMIQHGLEQFRITVARHVLEPVGEITVVRIGAHRNACSHAGLQLRWLHPPLLAGIVEEERFV
jgi:hypothetical protein